MRAHKRPIVAYTIVLNSLTDDEWRELKLPPVSSIAASRNVQLPILVEPSFDPVLTDIPVLSACTVTVCDEGSTAVVETKGFKGNVYEERQCHPECYAGLGGSQVCLFDDDDDVGGGLECVGDAIDSHGIITDQVVCPNNDMVPSVWNICDGNVPANLQLYLPTKPQEDNAPRPTLSVLTPSNDFGTTPSIPSYLMGSKLGNSPRLSHPH